MKGIYKKTVKAELRCATLVQADLFIHKSHDYWFRHVLTLSNWIYMQAKKAVSLVIDHVIVMCQTTAPTNG